VKFLLIMLSFIAFNSSASTSQFDCKYLDYKLVLKVKGFEHVVHELSINGKTLITELLNGSWFIEEVNCKKTGYEIVASHAQYNDPIKTVFMLTYSKEKGYRVVSGI
jgi:hypothetical protein